MKGGEGGGGPPHSILVIKRLKIVTGLITAMYFVMIIALNFIVEETRVITCKIAGSRSHMYC